jgi:uncharacterized protein YbaR (Trm112 family)
MKDTEKHNAYVCPQCREPLVEIDWLSVPEYYLHCRKCEKLFYF